MRPEDALARLPVPARRLAYRTAHRLLGVWWVVRRPHTHGVKCVLLDDGRILFVRHTYGDRDVWELPGGGLRHGEPPSSAAAREAREELGVDLPWTQVATIHARGRPKTTTLSVFTAGLGAGAVTVDPGEIAEARWAPAGDPPRPLSPSAALVLRHLDAHGGRDSA